MLQDSCMVNGPIRFVMKYQFAFAGICLSCFMHVLAMLLTLGCVLVCFSMSLLCC